MLKTYFSVVIALGFVTILTVTGCKSEEDFRIERANNARLHFEMAQFKELAQALGRDRVKNKEHGGPER